MLFVVSFVSGTFNTTAQITNGNVNPENTVDTTKKVKSEKEKVNRTFSKDSLSGTNFYITGLYQYTHRTFVDGSSFNYYADWEDQTSGYSGGADMGLIMELSKYFHVDIGISYFGNSENYSYQDSLTDSTYTYKNTYTQVAIPLRLRFVYGEKFQFFAFAGLAPLNILSIRNKASYLTADSLAVVRDLDVIKDGFAAFNLMITAGFGLCYNYKYVGFTIFPEIRRNLLNTYSTKTISMTHKLYGIGINAGFVFRF